MQRIVNFRYTVTSGDTSLDLDYSSTSALTLNGGSIQTSALDDALLTLPVPTTSGSLSYNKDIQIHMVSVSADINIPLNIEVDGTGTSTAPISSTSSDIILPSLNILGTGTSTSPISSTSADIVLPSIEVSGTGIVNIYTTLSDLIIPSVTITGIGTVTLPTDPQDVLDVQLVGEPYIDNWAYDISKDVKDEGEVLNDKAINVSIENILSTLRGERLFAPYFGSTLPIQIMEQIDVFQAENLLDELLFSIDLWEDRITIIKSEIILNILTNENSMTLILPYIINRNGLTGKFSRKIIL